MTDSLTRAAATRWHHGAPGAAVALRAAAARRLPGSAAAEAVYLRAGIGLTPPGRHSIHRRGLFEPGPGGTVRLRPGRRWRAAPIGGRFRHGRGPRAWARVRRVVCRAAGGARDLPGRASRSMAARTSWTPTAGNPCPRIWPRCLGSWPRMSISRIGVRPLGPFTLRTEGITPAGAASPRRARTRRRERHSCTARPT